MTKIAMADDHVLLRDALAEVINNFENCKVVLLAKDGKELLEGIRSGNVPDLILLDVAMKGMDGYETARILQKEYPGIKTLGLTMHHSDLVMVRLMQLGVCGILPKDIAPVELKEGIETAMRTGYYYSNNTASILGLLVKKGDADSPLLNNILLTSSEITFLQLCSEDMTYREIAIKMRLKPRTVDYYRNNLFTKLGVKSRAGLIQFAMKNGVLGGNK